MNKAIVNYNTEDTFRFNIKSLIWQVKRNNKEKFELCPEDEIHLIPPQILEIEMSLYNELKNSIIQSQEDKYIEPLKEDSKFQIINPYFIDKQFLVEKHAKDMLEMLKGVFDGQLLWHYNNGYYKNDGEAHYRVEGQRLLGGKSKKVHINESYYFATQHHRLIGDDMIMNPPCSLVNVKNGMLNPYTGELLSHSPEYLSTAQLPVEYDTDANDPIIHKFISQVLPVDSHDAVYEMIGYMLTNDLHLEKSFMLTGTGSNGKSVLINLISNLIGQENISSVSLQDLDHRFRLGGIEGKLLNAFSDLPQKAIEDTGNFKAIVSHEYITIEHKNKDPKRIKPTCKMLFSANHMVATPDMSDGYFRRWLMFEFKNTFKDGEKDIYLLEKLTTPLALSTFLNHAIEGLKRLYQNKRFSEGKSNINALEKYKLTSDCVASFINENCILKENAFIYTPEFYKYYKKWCNDNGLLPLSSIKVGGRMKFKKSRKFKNPEYWEGIGWAEQQY